ncbi:glycoside hydrolase family 2 protein [Pleomassaria siparia CBS 279.74]|uniref:Glycoside hydrolase family 2 protein n=1 Tax=Pleomassaria siparia CBS 279.74 TaxID=1314801 RepID=A0A6G1KM64_9PLEO|nr:glycoside hydrolase family 2 protein [Pleomassaria siparia CBS 279.74]
MSQRAFAAHGRDRTSLNVGWRFLRTEENIDHVVYDNILNDTNNEVLKPWILPSANNFINDADKHYQRPSGNPSTVLPQAQKDFDDSSWQSLDLPHDWAIQGPFYEGYGVPIGGGMGRLPVQGVGWYRRQLELQAEDKGKSIYLEVDGAMSYAMVWLNNKLVGGWPYGYNSFQLDLTPYFDPGKDNYLAIRLDNPTNSSRWYPGGGIYRNVWLTKVDPVHVSQWGTSITSREVSAVSAVVDAVVQIENKGNSSLRIEIATDIHVGEASGKKVGEFDRAAINLGAGERKSVNGSLKLDKPRLWNPVPNQQPNLYMAVTRLYSNNKLIDTFETSFGIRSLAYDANKGLLVNGEHVRIQGVNQHHDLGALGAAFNVRAAQRQLEVLREAGCNAIRMSHNPPAPELLDLTDRMGFLVMDEVFDMWELQKTPYDMHLTFAQWHEPILRAFLRRDRNHPSIIAWSIGNEVGEQTTGETGAAIARTLHDIVREEDVTRLVTASMNAAEPTMPFPAALDIISLNYQGEGIRDTPAYSHLNNGRRTPPQYPAFHAAFPDKMMLSTETAAALSTRGTYLFPVTDVISAPVNDTSGGNSTSMHVSSYELYSADFGSSVDKVFTSLDKNPYVAGEFVWSGWDYLGEPTPYYSARSSYFGLIDLAGFKKDRFFLYQSRWRPDLRMAHVLPHWTWPDRVGEVTPVHVFTAADEGELFLNGKSQGVVKKGEFEYRLRWDDVVYEPGELHLVTYKDGEEWANATVVTAGEAAQLQLQPDRSVISADGLDLSFVAVRVTDGQGNTVPEAANAITFSVSGPGELVATDNGDPTDLASFPSAERKAFSGFALAIVRGKRGSSGRVTVTAEGTGLQSAKTIITTR